MPFEQRHKEIIKKVERFSPAKLWANTFFFSAALFILGNIYLFTRRDALNIFANEASYNIFIANKVFASTAVVLIGLSLALSGLCYFWDFVDTKIIYRKYLGVMGLFYGIAHIIVTIVFLTEPFTVRDYLSRHPISAVFGALALIVLIYLGAISNRYAIYELGGQKWRNTMRYGGYTALLLVAVHYFVLKYNGWITWFKTFDPVLPPLSLLTGIFVVFVIVMRLALWMSVRKKKALENTDTKKQ